MIKFHSFFQLVLMKISLNLKSEASKSYLSYIWWVLEPIFYVAVLFVVFGVFLSRGGDDFVPFLVCGTIPFLWFSKSVSNSCNAISQGRGLISQVKINKAFFPIVIVGQDFVKQFVVIILLLAFLLFMGYQPVLNWLYLFILIIVELSVVITCSLFVAALVPILPDFKYLVTTGLQLLMFGSGIFYSYEEVILEEHQELFLMNPMANLIKNFRLVLLEGTPPIFESLFVIFSCSILLSLLILLFLNRYNSMYSKLVTE